MKIGSLVKRIERGRLDRTMPVGGKLLLKGGEALQVERKIKKKKKAPVEAPAAEDEQGTESAYAV